MYKNDNTILTENQQPKTTFGASSRMTPQDFEFVGVQHNKYLGDILDLLNQNKPIINYQKAMIIEKDFLINNYMESNISDSRAKGEFKDEVNEIIKLKGFYGSTNLYPKQNPHIL